MKRIVLAIVLLLLTAPGVAADTVYLRDGRVIRGTVIGFIGGRFAVRVAPSTGAATSSSAEAEGEIQFFRSRDVERVEIDGRSLDEARFETRTVEVALGPNWIDTGLDLRRDERVSVTANGTIVAGRSRITPGGLRSTDPTAPLPRSAEGVLIGAIGDDPNAPVVEIGLSREFVADRDGRLYLTVNRGRFDDARGSFSAQVRRERAFGPRRGAGTGAGARRTDEEEDDSIFEPSRRGPARTRPRSRSSQTGDPVGNPSDRGDERQRELTVRVPGNSQGVDTGLDLRNGDQVTISAEGTIVAGQRAGSVNANGRQGGIFGNPRYPFPQAGAGALLGVVRDTAGRQAQPFLVGTQLTFNAQADGRLFLLVNDDNYTDNSGEFVVRIRLN
jgi:hypothetical protein